MKQNEEVVLEWTGLSEGGYSNHKDDPGGPTDRGITQATYNAWNKLKGKPQNSVKGISKAEAEDILVSQYLTPIRFSDLPSGLDYAVADFSINSGPSRAAKELQRVLGVKQDGVIGLKTLAALKTKNPQMVIVDYCKRRLAFMQDLKNWPSFKNGWTIRVMGKVGGQQDDDIGVIDRAVRLSKHNVYIPAPTSVGSGKADDTKTSFWKIIIDFFLTLIGKRK